MSRSKEVDAATHLRRIAVRAIVDQLGLREEHALPFADAVIGVLQAEYGGERLHIPKRIETVEAAVVRADLERGVPTRKVLSTYGLSRAKLHRMFPGGLPKPLMAGIANGG